MPLFALELVIGAAILHAIWNTVAKKCGADPLIFGFLVTAASGVVWLPVLLPWLIVYSTVSPIHWNPFAWLVVIASAGLHSLYLLALLRGYKVAPLTVVYPVARGTGPLISSFLGAAFFHEALHPTSVMGIVSIVLGVLLLASGRSEPSMQRGSSSDGIAWGGLVGILIALYTLVDAYAVKALALNVLGYDYVIHLLRAVLLLPFVVGRLTEVRGALRQHFSAVAIVGALSPGAYILVLVAIKLAPLSHVAPARELSLLFGALFGGTFLREGHLFRRMMAATTIAVGVALLSAR